MWNMELTKERQTEREERERISLNVSTNRVQFELEFSYRNLLANCELKLTLNANIRNQYRYIDMNIYIVNIIITDYIIKSSCSSN